MANQQLTLTDTQMVKNVAIDPKDSKGYPAFAESIQWATSDPDVLAIVPHTDDPKVVDIVAGKPGKAQVTVSADVQEGDGVTTKTGVLDVTVLAGEAVSFTISVGTPQEQDPTPTA